jgi:ATP-dependent exoDNAse (exonuclease V) alpha subunit
VFAVNDKVMILANDNKIGLTNGMIGVVEEIVPNGNFGGAVVAQNIIDENADFDLTDFADELDANISVDKEDKEDENERAASHIMKVKFQNVTEVVDFETAGAFKKISHAYAFTCHKAQGGEYPNVVILAHSCNLGMLSREWLYTAITRAQKRVILLCNHRGLTHAVNLQKIKGNTIAEKAKQFLALQGKEDTQLPNLAEPETINYVKLTIGG